MNDKSVTIECLAYGKPLVRYSWKKDSKLLKTPEIDNLYFKLLIPSNHKPKDKINDTKNVTNPTKIDNKLNEELENNRKFVDSKNILDQKNNINNNTKKFGFGNNNNSTIFSKIGNINNDNIKDSNSVYNNNNNDRPVNNDYHHNIHNDNSSSSYYNNYNTSFYPGSLIITDPTIEHEDQNTFPITRDPRIHYPLLHRPFTIKCRLPSGYPTNFEVFWGKSTDGGEVRRVEENDRLAVDRNGGYGHSEPGMGSKKYEYPDSARPIRN
ncbi:hypothetical protein HELRODRAFT_178295 [Helobdella robusta]|uniref:Ig-like domain-containing protein n=1 Tax=Helobdella robusta TaxID=6412 RepID=T1FD19_HELRO|nr:hypothetical protein HELRODRAFT_178295 [Helobdella robusta]ESN97183.1 hypothetical protein HELRODRAFT_178295 [Helobdella robusta]